ncbi:MAG: hypothetical protein K2N73_04960, partial [Lachnospiraceae bacterium]|nr:hypothetical protein [Lachnospiraceae bacterium]
MTWFLFRVILYVTVHRLNRYIFFMHSPMQRKKPQKRRMGRAASSGKGHPLLENKNSPMQRKKPQKRRMGRAASSGKGHPL